MFTENSKTAKTISPHGVDATADGATASAPAAATTLSTFLASSLDARSAIDSVDAKTGLTALMTAAAAGNVECMTVLLEHKANVNATSKGETALYHAVCKGFLPAVKLLLDNRADTAIEYGADTKTVLRMALDSGNADLTLAIAGGFDSLRMASSVVLVNSTSLSVTLVFDSGEPSKSRQLRLANNASCSCCASSAASYSPGSECRKRAWPSQKIVALLHILERLLQQLPMFYADGTIRIFQNLHAIFPNRHKNNTLSLSFSTFVANPSSFLERLGTRFGNDP